MNVHENQTFEQNSWLDGVEKLPSFPSIDNDTKTDWLVVGAGFTGVAAARQIALAKPNDSVLLIDAGELLGGSSSRSSGFVVPIGHFYRPGSDENKKFYRLGREAIGQLHDLVQMHNIECDWNDAGRLIGARAAPGLKSLSKIRRSLEALNSPVARFSADEVQQHTGMTSYLAAIRQTESVMVNPAQLLRGLVQSLPENVTVRENSAVSSVSSDGNVVVANGPKIESSKTILCVNALASSLGVGRNRVFPMRTYVSVIRVPVKEGEDSRWGITSSERVGSSIRRVGDRLFIRNTAEFGLGDGGNEAELQRIAEFQLQSLKTRFAGAAEVDKMRVENIWSGSISITANGASMFGQSSGNVFFATGYNGHGIAHGTASGRLLADLAMGIESEQLSLIQSLNKPNWIPFGFILKAGVDAYLRWLLWRYGAEE